jgi:ABC-type polysaccharide/polyol phosphate transport system ATPase subunit
MTDAAIAVNGVSKKFRLYKERNQSIKSAVMRGKTSVHEDFWALKNIDFEIRGGETFGLVGDNGSGKSTLLKCMARILYPDKGSIVTKGRVAALLEVGSGFHPELSGRENVFLNGSILGMSKKEIERKFDEIVDFSGVREFIDQPVKNYSSGMYVRLGFSVAIHVDPDILLVDEVLAVGDETFQAKCFDKFTEFKAAGKTVVIVSHAMGSLVTMCDRLALIRRGELQMVGDPEAVVEAYRSGPH